MKKFSKKVLALILAVSIIGFAGIGVLAYYIVSSTQNATLTTNITDENVIEIATYDDLFEHSKNSKYNDESLVSNISDRAILKLMADIDLVDDLEITNDVHINLNSHKLNLNGFELTFRHGYAGCINIFGGSISQGDGTGKITLDLPNGSIFTNGVTYYSSGSTTTTEANCINVSNLNQKYTAYTALYMVSNSIASDLNQNIRMDDFDTVTANDYVINQAKFIRSKLACSYNSNSADICSYVYKDLDLPTHYLSTDIEITYTSSNTNVVSTSGKVSVPSTEQDVTLTASINHSSWNSAITCTFKLHVLNLNNSTVKNNVAKDLIKDLLADYYVEGSLKIDETRTISNFYEFAQGIQLPLFALGGNITYSYSMTDYSGSNQVTTTSHPITGTNMYALEPNDQCFHLVIRMNNSENLTLNIYSVYVTDQETIARLILNKLYGGSVIYNSSDPSKVLTQFSELSTALDSTTYSYVSLYGITGLTYALKTGATADVSAGTYFDYSNYTLTVKDGVTPPAKTSYVTATFTFGTGVEAETVSIDLYLNYLAESGDTISGFLPYYNLYDPQVFEELSSSFEMPFAFSNGAPYTCYDVATSYTTASTIVDEETFTYYDSYTLGIPSGLSISLYYNGQKRFTFTSSATSLTTQLDSYLSANSLTLKNIADYGDAKYIFEVDAQNAQTVNTNVLLIYNYKFTTGGSWHAYNYTVDNSEYYTELTTSTFKLCGGLFYNTSSSATNAVKDKTFFAWIYNNFNPSSDTITSSSVNSSSFIPMAWLSLDVALESLSGVTDYSGIGHLVGVTKVDLSGISLTSSILSSIASMPNVATLKLKGCSITDITNLCTMQSIKVLDVSNNSIKDFTNLMNLQNLEEVYVYGNYYNSSTDYNKIYGADGILNYQTYYDLLGNGVGVYNLISGTVPQLFGISDQPNDYARLKSIAYQDKLKSGKSIETLYAPFSGLSATNFGLENTGGTLTWSYGGGTDATDATYFQVTYSFTNSGTTYNLVVKYYVDRY